MRAQIRAANLPALCAPEAMLLTKTYLKRPEAGIGVIFTAREWPIKAEPVFDRLADLSRLPSCGSIDEANIHVRLRDLLHKPKGEELRLLQMRAKHR